VTRRSLVLASALLCCVSRPGSAQGTGAEILTTVESWKTDGGSRLLSRNAGDPALYGQLYGWFAYQPSRTIRLLAIAEVYAHSGHDSEVEGSLEMLSARWWHSRALRIEGGKILLPIGEFASRRFSNTNPLIGEPDTYVSEYPWGASISGAIGVLDYTAAAVSLPAVNVRYTPEPSARVRPVLGIGITPGPGFRIGAAVTRGSYLNSGLDSLLPPVRAWQDYQQTVATFDLHYSAGRFDNHVEVAASAYDVPTVTKRVNGLGWYAESRVTVSPRVFVAGRFEHNRYPFVLPINVHAWVGVETTQMNGEAGVGYRFNPDALVKMSLRRDHWPVHQAGTNSFPDGYAVALQFSMHTDLIELFHRKP
jgi:hypothetical protein